MKRVALPTKPIVTPEAVERLMRKFTERKSAEARAKFWAGVQERKQPQRPVDWERLPV